jgi:hypothetical protein
VRGSVERRRHEIKKIEEMEEKKEGKRASERERERERVS